MTEQNEGEVTNDAGQPPSNEQSRVDAENPEKAKPEELCSDEDLRLGFYSPLSTLFRLVGGPILSQITSACYGLVDSMWISKSIGEIGLTATSTSYTVDYAGLAFGHFVNVAASTQISYLYGQKRNGDVSQVIVDLIRVCCVLGILVPAVLIPISKPLMRWLSNGAENIVDMAFYYLLPVLVGAITAMIYLLGCGVLQAQGRTWLYGAAQISSFIINGLIFDPIFLFALKTDVWGAAMSTMIAELIPGAVILFCLLRGKLGIKFSCDMWKKWPSRDTWIALKVGLSSLIMQLSIIIPAIFMQKYIALTAEYVNQFDDIMAMWNVVLRLNQLSICVVIAFNTAYLPAASYAYGKHDYGRIVKLTLHTLWVTFIWALICTGVICLFPRQLGRIWSSKDSFLGWIEKILPKAFLAVFLCPVPYISIAFLQAVNRPMFASVLSVLTNLLPLPIFSSIMYFTDRTDPARLFWAYVMKDGFSLVASLSMIAYPFIQILRNKHVPVENNLDDISESSSEKSKDAVN